MLKSTQENILHPIFAREIPFLYPNVFHRHKHHQGKATSHTLISTTAFLERMKIDSSVYCIPFRCRREVEFNIPLEILRNALLSLKSQ